MISNSNKEQPKPASKVDAKPAAVAAASSVGIPAPAAAGGAITKQADPAKVPPAKEPALKTVFCLKEVALGEWGVFSKKVAANHVLGANEFPTLTVGRKVAVDHAKKRISHLQQAIKNLKQLRMPTVPKLESKVQ